MVDHISYLKTSLVANATLKRSWLQSFLFYVKNCLCTKYIKCQRKEPKKLKSNILSHLIRLSFHRRCFGVNQTLQSLPKSIRHKNDGLQVYCLKLQLIVK